MDIRHTTRGRSLKQQSIRDLFQRDFRIARISEREAVGKSDHFVHLCRLISANEQAYPGINKWLRTKVVPGLATGERVAFVGYDNEKPVASAVVKRGTCSKFCHLKLADDFQDLNIGEAFFTLMAFEIHEYSHEVHFTLPESLWKQRANFFQSFGFLEASEAYVQYRLFEKELRCSSSFGNIWLAARSKLVKLLNNFGHGNLEKSLLMSIRPQHAHRILSGSKTVEIRRRFAEKWLGHKVSFYASGTVRSLVGEARIANISSGSPDAIWEQFASEINCQKEDYRHYVGDANKVFAIALEEVSRYPSHIPVRSLSNFIGAQLTPPQSYRTLGSTDSWANAVTIATMLSETVQQNS